MVKLVLPHVQCSMASGVRFDDQASVYYNKTTRIREKYVRAKFLTSAWDAPFLKVTSLGNSLLTGSQPDRRPCRGPSVCHNYELQSL